MQTQSLDTQYAAALELKGRFNSSLSDLLTELNENRLTSKTYNLALSSLSEFTTKFEHFLTNASSDTIYISKTHTEDILASIENILILCADSWKVFEVISNQLNTPISLPTGSYLFTSQAIFKTYKKHRAEEIESIYNKLNLPISGFKHKKPLKFNQMKIHIPQTVAGSILMLAGTALAFFMGLETGMQYFISRILIALGAGFLITGLTKDYIKTKFNINGTTITASGAIAIFLILFFFNPAPAPTYTPDSQASQVNPSSHSLSSPSETGN